MPVERKSRIVEGRNALRALAPRWVAVAGARFEQGGFARKNRLDGASAGKRYSRFQAAADVNGDSAWHFGKTLIAALHKPTIRSLVRKACCSRGRRPRLTTDVFYAPDCRGHRPRLQEGLHHPVGRHICALSRTAHRHRGSQSAGSARVQSCACEKSALLRATGI